MTNSPQKKKSDFQKLFQPSTLAIDRKGEKRNKEICGHSNRSFLSSFSSTFITEIVVSSGSLFPKPWKLSASIVCGEVFIALDSFFTKSYKKTSFWPHLLHFIGRGSVCSPCVILRLAIF